MWGLFTLDNFRTLLSTPDVVESIITSVVASSVAVLFCVPLGFLVANLLVRGRRLRFFGSWVMS